MTESIRDRLRAIPVFEDPAPAVPLSDFPPDPLQALGDWIFRAAAAGQPEAHAMTLATAAADGTPSTRTLICKDIDRGRLYFASRSDSPKGVEIAQNSRVAAHFHWPWVGRQIRITGVAAATGRAASQADFAERGRDSQLAAHLHGTAEPHDRRQILDAYDQLTQAHPDQVPCPPEWTRYAIEPISLEFWQASPHRIHHRVRYERDGSSWTRRLMWP
ncbi:pyridoxine/pyridoxamine 5'-phosphate oxidase [Streptacidiphilus carbonis]|uniref:pyridoxine/pyridoxamine 5'-phosphate oxidase n=1 Tax=Streptacidiphilus carbonis TaxID=105422 RepID=UPI0005A9F5BC|nr:pyridoxal 5'-phosphate synthase [Streptacidiphilus carbonis]